MEIHPDCTKYPLERYKEQKRITERFGTLSFLTVKHVALMLECSLGLLTLLHLLEMFRAYTTHKLHASKLPYIIYSYGLINEGEETPRGPLKHICPFSPPNHSLDKDISLTKPHMIIPDSSAINSVSTSTGHPDNTELNTALAEVPGGSSTTMKATPGELIRGMNLLLF